MVRIEHAVERGQTGVCMERRVLQILRALAIYHDLALGDLLEGIVLHAFDGKSAFRQAGLQRIKELRKFYGLDWGSRSSHSLSEAAMRDSQKKEKTTK